jgi:hypothetical protein
LCSLKTFDGLLIAPIHGQFFSDGKTSLMVGMAQLFSFVKVLEEDYLSVMRGIPIKYGVSHKGDTNIAQTIGWDKKRKRAPPPPKISETITRHASVNDGQPTDTMKELVPTVKAKRKVGRPAGSQNINCSIFTAYPSYWASNTEKLKNRCWLAAALESLYALYSPLWLRGSTGNGNTMFHTLVNHFLTRATAELTLSGSISGLLTGGHTTLFNHVNALYPDSFVPGRFASCDGFMEHAISPTKNPTRSLQGLF